MTNEVIQTLEDAQSSAEGGAYEYKLTYVGSDNAEKVLYDSTTVGGEGASKAGEGLKQIDNSTQEYFYLGRLASNNTGTVHQCACPWLPYPMIAIFCPSRRERLQSS